MKLIGILLLLPLISFGQRIAVENGKLNGVLPLDESGQVTYQFVKQAEGVSQAELFKRARKWFTKTYKSSKDVLQVADGQTGELAGKGIFLLNIPWAGMGHDYPIRHAITVEVRDGRYRTRVTDLSIEDLKVKTPIEKMDMPMVSKKFITRFYEGLDSKIMTLVQSLDTAMATADDF